MRVIARRHRPLVVIDKEVITYSRNKIYKINIIDGTMEFICKLFYLNTGFGNDFFVTRLNQQFYYLKIVY